MILGTSTNRAWGILRNLSFCCKSIKRSLDHSIIGPAGASIQKLLCRIVCFLIHLYIRMHSYQPLCQRHCTAGYLGSSAGIDTCNLHVCWNYWNSSWVTVTSWQWKGPGFWTETESSFSHNWLCHLAPDIQPIGDLWTMRNTFAKCL